MKLIGFYDYTVILTYMNLISGCFGIFAAAKGKPGLAMIFLLLSGLFDMFDGAVARSKKNRTEDEKSFGIQLDSICDLVCFGVFPAIYLFFNGVNSIFGIIILVLYILCALIRLAYFNVLEIKRQQVETGCAKGFRGLPVTSAAIIFPILFGIGKLVAKRVMTPVYYVVTILTAFLFVADFHFPKLDVAAVISKLKHADK